MIKFRKYMKNPLTMVVCWDDEVRNICTKDTRFGEMDKY